MKVFLGLSFWDLSEHFVFCIDKWVSTDWSRKFVPNNMPPEEKVVMVGGPIERGKILP